MPRLVLLNGPPGSGKSTLAQRYVDEHPLAASLDVDLVRAMIGGWREHLTDAGLAARALTLAMARTHLDAGHDVIVPQYLGRLGFIEALEGLAAGCGVAFLEIVLMTDRNGSIRRYQGRGGDEPQEALEQMYDRLIALLPSRPNARVIDTLDGELEAAYRALLGMLT